MRSFYFFLRRRFRHRTTFQLTRSRRKKAASCAVHTVFHLDARYGSRGEVTTASTISRTVLASFSLLVKKELIAHMLALSIDCVFLFRFHFFPPLEKSRIYRSEMDRKIISKWWCFLLEKIHFCAIAVRNVELLCFLFNRDVSSSNYQFLTRSCFLAIRSREERILSRVSASVGSPAGGRWRISRNSLISSLELVASRNYLRR